MAFRCLLLTSLFHVIYHISSSQIIQGVVRDAVSGEPLPGAIVWESAGGKSASTSVEGSFQLSLPSIPTTIRARLLNYQPDSIYLERLPANDVILVLKLKPRENALNTLVVSASKYAQNLEQVVVSMDILRPNIIENKNTTSLENAMQQVPGVSVVDAEPQIRSGSGYSFGAGSRVMIMVDGLPLLSGDAGRPIWGFLPLENVAQIEVIKGASSVLYGSAAIAGVFNILSAYPKEKPETRLSFFSGVYDRPRTREGLNWNRNPTYHNLQFNHTRKWKGWDVVLGGNFFVDEGFIGPTPAYTGINPATDTATREYEHRARFNFNLRRNSKKIKGLQYGLNANGMLNNSANTLIWFNAREGLYNSYPGAITETLQQTAYIDPFVSYNGPKGWKTTFKNRYYYLNNNNTNNQSNLSQLIYSELQTQKAFEWQNKQQLVMSYGLVNLLTWAWSDLYKGNVAEQGATSSQAGNQAAYAQLDYSNGKRLNLSAGARWERFLITEPVAKGSARGDAFSDSKPVFRSGINYRVHKASFLRASVGQGFRFPTIGEKYIRTAVGPINIYPSTDLTAETAQNYELGIKQAFRLGGLTGFVDWAFFRQDFQNTIEFNFGQWGSGSDPLFGLGFRSVNIGRSRVTGTELTLAATGKLGKTTINILTGYTYTLPIALEPDKIIAKTLLGEVSYAATSSDTTGRILKYRFQHLYKGDIEALRGKWMWGFSARYNSFMQNIDKLFEDLDDLAAPPFALLDVAPGLKQYRKDNRQGVWVFDVRAGYQISSLIRLSLVCDNLLNREYSLRPMVIERMRTYSIQVSARF